MTAAARGKNPRSIALAYMRYMKKHLTWGITDWDSPPSLRWYDDGDGKGTHWHNEPRKRADVPYDEYPENRPAAWLLLAERMDKLVERAANLARFARVQHIEAVKRQEERERARTTEAEPAP